MKRGQPVSFALVALVAMLATLGSIVVWAVLVRDASLVPLAPWITLVTPVVLGLLVLLAAWPVRAYVKAPKGAPFDRLRAARILVLAQASALTGAVGVGWYAGQLVIVSRDLALLANQDRAWRLLIALACAAALVGAGLLAQHWCKLPPSDDPPALPTGEGQEAL